MIQNKTKFKFDIAHEMLICPIGSRTYYKVYIRNDGAVLLETGGVRNTIIEIDTLSTGSDASIYNQVIDCIKEGLNEK
jgi:hypothetical protein